MNSNSRYTNWQYVLDIWHYVKPYRRQFFVGVFFRFTSDVSDLYPPWALSRIVIILSQPVSPDSITQLFRIFLTGDYSQFIMAFLIIYLSILVIR